MATSNCTQQTANEKEVNTTLKNLPEGIFAEITTSKGKMLAELFYEQTPMTVANFVGLSEGNLTYQGITIEKPYYDGIIFHRVIQKFMIQTGDPMGTGMGGPGYNFGDEIVAGLSHNEKGILSMANAGPKTNGSQFFITQVPTAYLDGKHTVFGKVIAGLDIIDSIANVEKDASDRPKDAVTIQHIEIIRKGEKAQTFKGQNLFANEVQQYEKNLEAKNEERKKEFVQKVLTTYPQAKTTSSGLMYQIENENTTAKNKTVTVGNTVDVHYKGILLTSGQQFDSSYERNRPLTTIVGKQSLIPGFEEGLLLGKKGQKIKLFIPYYLAYGEAGVGPIPGFADLIFEIEILEVK